MCTISVKLTERLMREDTRAEREAQIFEAGYRLLVQKGYVATSMLAIAKAANASNETLYRWYGDKKGLFRRMVERNAEGIRHRLAAVLANETDPVVSLEQLAPVLLGMLVGEAAISLSRAAASDETGELGAAISAAGRETIFPMIESVVQRGMDASQFHAPTATVAAEWYLALLVGDLQVRRVNRTLAPLTDGEVQLRAEIAGKAFRKLIA